MRERIARKPYINRRHKLVSRIKRDRYLLLMMIPVVTFYILFHYVPMYGVTIAFKRYNMFSGVFASPWIGFENFCRIFRTSDFYTVLRNTLTLNLLSLIIGFPGPIILALLLNELRSTLYKRTIQTVAYLPHFLSWVVVANMMVPMLSPGSGVVNNLIKSFGFEAIYFMGDKTWWIVSYVVIGLWKSVGWGAIIYLAALSGIDQALYEAARIDGAGRWKQCLKITIPSISPTIIILLILNLGSMMSIGFDQPYLLGNASVIEVSDVISTYVYRIGLQSLDISRSTAIGLFQSLVNLILLLSANTLAKKFSGSGIY